MTKLFRLAILSLLLLLVSGCNREGFPAGRWVEDPVQGLEQARSAGKPVLLAFTREDTSPWSGRLRKEVFDTAAFHQWAEGKVVLVKADLSAGQDPKRVAQAAELAAKYKVVGFPTVVLLNPQREELGSLRYQAGGPTGWTTAAQAILEGKSPVEPPWFHELKEAQAESSKTGKPILIDFTGSDWCIFCIKLRDEVFSTEQFRQWAAAKVVLLEIDFPRNFDMDPIRAIDNEELANKYNVNAFPTLMLVQSDGSVLGQLGYAEGGPKVWLAQADAILAKSSSKSAP